MNFFRTTFLLCTRISALTLLKDVPVWRACLHMALLLILCPILLASIQLRVEKREISTALEWIQQETGGFRFSGDGTVFLGSGAAEQHLAFRLLGTDTRLDYLTKGIPLDPDAWKENTGLIITPDNLYIWTRPVEARYTMQKIPAAMAGAYFLDKVPEKRMSLTQMLDMELYSGKQIAEKIGESTGENRTQPGGEIVALEKLKFALQTMLWALLFSATFHECLLLILIGSITFSIVQTMRFRLLPNRLKFPKIFALTLYATFPALLIATLLTATGQQILMFQTIFFPVFFLYQLMSFNNLMRHMNPVKNNNDNHDEEEF